MPFIILVVGGSFGLKEFTQVKYVLWRRPALHFAFLHFPFRFQYYVKPPIRQDEMESQGIHMKGKGEVTIDTEYEKIKSIDLDNWEQKRGPRPWEE